MPGKQAKDRRSTGPAKKRPTSSSPSNSRRLEEGLEIILETTTEGYWDWKISSGKVYYGKGWLSSLGYSAHDLPRDESFLDSMIHPDDLDCFHARVNEHLRGRTSALDYECRLRAKSGHYKWFRMRGKVVQRNARSEPLRMVGTVSDIDAQVRSQADLEKSQAHMEALFQSTNDVIWSVSPEDFRLLAFNKAFENFMLQATGIQPRAGLPPEALGPSDRAQSWSNLYAKTLEHGEVDCDFPAVTGAVLHLMTRRVSRNGRAFAISIFGHDITERKRMEIALRKSEEKFAKAFMASPMALSLSSARDHRYLEVNEFFEKATGYTRAEVIGKTPFDLNIWVDPEQRRALAQEILKKGMVRNLELQFRTKTGAILHGFGSADLIEVDGEPCLLAVTQDVTDRKQAEQALKDSEERLRIAIQVGNMFAFQWDLSSDSVQRSEESSRIFNPKEAGIPSTHREFVENIHPEDQKQYLGVIHSLAPERPSYQVLFRFNHPDRSYSWLQESGRGFFGPDGKLQRIVGITTDVTDTREAERTLRDLSARLITSQEEERRRVARELHDNIGQELALLAAQSQRVDSGVAQQENTLRSDVHEIYKRVKDIATTVSQLSHRLHSSELDFLGLGIAVERLCRDFGSQHGIDVQYVPRNVPRNLDTAIALCFYRVIQEALQNVAKHSQAKLVQINLTEHNRQLTLSVEDDGIGFDVEKVRFESGLGLISVRERMHVIGGQCTISSQKGTGTKLEASVAITAGKAL